MATKPIFDDVPAWPDRAGPAPQGHNQPPLDVLIPADFERELLRERPDFLTKFDDIIGAVDRVKITDDASLGRAGDLDNLMRAADAHVTKTHVAVKAPYLAGGRLVDDQKNTMLARLAGPRSVLKAAMNEFVAEREARMRAERERIAAESRAAAARALAAEREREQAEREAAKAMRDAANAEEREAALERARLAEIAAEEAMAAASLAPAAAARTEPVRSDGGASVSTSTVWNSEVDDYLAAFKAVKDDPKVREAIDASIKRQVRAGKREIKGVRIWPTQEARSR